jgi:hypothetical protein
MSVEIKKIVIDEKALQLKIINQLEPISVMECNLHSMECLGYYNIKKLKKYIFKNGNNLNTYIDYGWSISKNFKHKLIANGNRFKSFDNDEKRDIYFDRLTKISNKLVEMQLFY